MPAVAPVVPPVASARPAGAQPPAVAPIIPPVAPATGRPVPAIAPVVPPVASARPAGAQPPAMAPVVPPVAPARPGQLPPAAPGARPASPARPPAPTADAARGAVGNLTAEQLLDLEQRTNTLDELDYFQLLKLERTATPADIKKAFYRESRAYHPDRFFHLPEGELKTRVHELYKRVTEAYYVLRDDVKRKKYLADISGPERAQKLRFTEASEAETKLAAKKEQEEAIGTHPKGRQFYQTAMADIDGERWTAAERNLKMALTYEPQNARYKEKLSLVQAKLNDLNKQKGDGFKIK